MSISVNAKGQKTEDKGPSNNFKEKKKGTL